MDRMKGKRAVVSAATNGIGLAVALRLAEEGARVYLGARNGEKAQKIIDAHPELDLHWSLFDADKPETFAGFVNQAAEECGGLDVLVNNFGGTDVKVDLDILHTEPDDFMRLVERNLKITYSAVKAVLPHMIASGGGSIVNVSSVGGLYPDMQRTAYGVSKAAINFLTKDTAVQYAKQGVRCNAVLPAYTETDAAKHNMTPEFLKAFLTTVPLPRQGFPEDLAQAVLFLASDESSYITGELLPVGGGFGLPTPMYPLYMMQGAKG